MGIQSVIAACVLSIVLSERVTFHGKNPLAVHCILSGKSTFRMDLQVLIIISGRYVGTQLL